MLANRFRPIDTADGRAVAISAGQREALARCEHVIESRRPLGVMLGPSGTGKSTLLRRLAAFPRATDVFAFDMTGRDGWELVAELAADWNLGRPEVDRSERLRSVRDRLEGAGRCGAASVLLLDHLDAARPHAYEMLAHLLRTAAGPGSLTVIAAAQSLQPEGLANLQRDFGWVRIEIGALSPPEALPAVSIWIEQATAGGRGLAADAAREAIQLTRGVPRELRQLAELAALAAEADRAESISPELLQQAAQETAVHTLLHR